MATTITLPISPDAAKRAERRVFKYALDVTDHQTILMPAGAEILCVQMQAGAPCLWAMVNPNNPLEERRFRIVGTGHLIAEPFLKYVGTVQAGGGMLIWHVFEVTA